MTELYLPKEREKFIEIFAKAGLLTPVNRLDDIKEYSNEQTDTGKYLINTNFSSNTYGLVPIVEIQRNGDIHIISGEKELMFVCYEASIDDKRTGYHHDQELSEVIGEESYIVRNDKPRNQHYTVHPELAKIFDIMISENKSFLEANEQSKQKTTRRSA